MVEVTRRQFPWEIKGQFFLFFVGVETKWPFLDLLSVALIESGRSKKVEAMAGMDSSESMPWYLSHLLMGLSWFTFPSTIQKGCWKVQYLKPWTCPHLGLNSIEKFCNYLMYIAQIMNGISKCISWWLTSFRKKKNKLIQFNLAAG